MRVRSQFGSVVAWWGPTGPCSGQVPTIGVALRQHCRLLVAARSFWSSWPQSRQYSGSGVTIRVLWGRQRRSVGGSGERATTALRLDEGMSDFAVTSPEPPVSVVAVLVLLFALYFVKQLYEWAKTELL